MPHTSNTVAFLLKQHGVPVLEVSPIGDEHSQTDGFVQITEDIHVQVGHDYVIVVKEERGKFKYYSNRAFVSQLLPDLKMAGVEFRPVRQG